jgi:hypothetical protein
MLHAYVQRFYVTENLKILAKFLASKRCLSREGVAESGSAQAARNNCNANGQAASDTTGRRRIFFHGIFQETEGSTTLVCQGRG